MSGSRLRKHYELQEEKLSIDFITDRGEYHSAHWQHDLEMIYLLNGSALLSIDGESQTLVQGEFVVIDSNRIYELSCKDSFMEIRIRVNREAQEGEVSLPGTIESREYYGLYIKYYIRCAGQIIKVIERNDGINLYEPGQQVTVGVHVRNLMSYPRQ